jgi:hypothetical protein
MKLHRFLAGSGVLLIVVALALVAALPAFAQEESPPNPVGEPPTFLRGFYDDWVNSAHADVTAEAFNHWNEDEAKVVPETCARCHSTPGYQDYLGADGSEAGVVDTTAPLGTVINCDACHNEVAWHLTEVTFPSGVEVGDLNDSSRCMVCHQGRAWSGTVDQAIEDAGLLDQPNTVSEDLRFINIHYYAAAASLYGSEAHGGYEWAGNRYQMRFEHTAGMDTCIDCHSPHTLEVQVQKCGDCHDGVETLEDVQNIRMNGSRIDYDGDGNVDEGIKAELEGLHDMLYKAIQNYAADVAGTPIVYDANSYPYFFADDNDNGAVDEGEGGYSSFTPDLLRAAYNYQVTQKDPGAFAHNAKYHIELMYDSIAALNADMSQQVDLSMAHRDDPGHFNSTGEPFRHWDAAGEVEAACTKCHTAEGLPFFMEYGTLIPREPSNSLSCSTCHDNIGEFTLYQLDEVTFPSGATISFGEGKESNLCLMCHQGRESTVSVNNAIANSGAGPNEVSDALNFRNVHYFAAGATLFGSEAEGAYQYPDKVYTGRNEHTRQFDECADCHDVHALTVQYEECGDCHENVDIQSEADVLKIRGNEDDIEIVPVDYDGDGNVTEPIRDEIASFQDALLAAIQKYANETIGTAIGYTPDAYPYWYVDVNGDGVITEDEISSDTRYTQWTPTLLKATYNYQYVIKDPGAFAHNPRYILQVLYDSIENIGGPDAVANFTRAPEFNEES